MELQVLLTQLNPQQTMSFLGEMHDPTKHIMRAHDRIKDFQVDFLIKLKLVATVPPQDKSGCKSQLTKSAAIHLFLSKIFATNIPRFSDIYNAIIRDDEKNFETMTISQIVIKYLQVPDDRYHLTNDGVAPKLFSTTSAMSVFQTASTIHSLPAPVYVMPQRPIPSYQGRPPYPPRPPRPPFNQNRTLGSRVANISAYQRALIPRPPGIPYAPNQPIVCHNCGRPGHIARNCFQPPRNTLPYYQPLSNVPRAPPVVPTRIPVNLTTAYQSTITGVDDETPDPANSQILLTADTNYDNTLAQQTNLPSPPSTDNPSTPEIVDLPHKT
jgi:hypothetical protein